MKYNVVLLLAGDNADSDVSDKELLSMGLRFGAEGYTQVYLFDDFSFVLSKEEIEDPDRIWSAPITGENLCEGLEYRTLGHSENDLFNSEDVVLVIDKWEWR